MAEARSPHRETNTRGSKAKSPCRKLFSISHSTTLLFPPCRCTRVLLLPFESNCQANTSFRKLSYAYFKATFDGDFQEGKEQSTTLKEKDGVVSIRSFELLVKWLHLGRVVLGTSTPPIYSISAVVEFVRIADMCRVTGMEGIMAEQIKTIIITNPAPISSDLDSNTYCLNSSHIVSAASLPEGHPVRKVLAAAAAGAFFREDNHKFSKEVKEVASFASDLLEAIKDTLKSFETRGSGVLLTDPLTGGNRWLRH